MPAPVHIASLTSGLSVQCGSTGAVGSQRADGEPARHHPGGPESRRVLLLLLLTSKEAPEEHHTSTLKVFPGGTEPPVFWRGVVCVVKILRKSSDTSTLQLSMKARWRWCGVGGGAVVRRWLWCVIGCVKTFGFQRTVLIKITTCCYWLREANQM